MEDLLSLIIKFNMDVSLYTGTGVTIEGKFQENIISGKLFKFYLGDYVYGIATGSTDPCCYKFTSDKVKEVQFLSQSFVNNPTRIKLW